MMHKGRPVSHAGRDAGGPRDGVDGGRDESAGAVGVGAVDPGAVNSGAGDSNFDPAFDPFESFDAHDEAEGRGKSSQRGQRVAGATPLNGASSSPAETTYTRSRRTPGESSVEKDKAEKSKRPIRSLKGRALGYLSRREYSRTELSRKLAPFVEETDSLEALLDALESEGWLSDSRFAESLLHRRASRLGASRIVGELKRHAVDQTLIEEASAQLRETELARAQAVWSKKFGQLPETPAERARQARFLAARGFSGATIGKILKGLDEDRAGE